ncbi:MAG TPA: hypothetical protein VIU15_47980 [Streptomyces sp.]
MTLMNRVKTMLQSAMPEISIPLVLATQTGSLSCLAVKLRWNTVFMASLTVLSALCGPVVPDQVWWGIVFGSFFDRSHLVYWRCSRR